MQYTINLQRNYLNSKYPGIIKLFITEIPKVFTLVQNSWTI
jgi:hypothetical protein